MMSVLQVPVRLLGAALIVVAFSSVGDARWFRGRYGYDFVPAYSACYAPTTQPSLTPTGSVSAATTGTMAYQANKPAAAPEQPLPTGSSNSYAAPTYPPGAMPGGQSVLPRSSWDYGRFPPYR